MQCSNCGNQLTEGDTACPRCGSPVDSANNQTYTATKKTNEVPSAPMTMPQAQVAPIPQNVEPPVQESKVEEGKGRKILIVFILIAILILLSIMVYSVAFSSNTNRNNSKASPNEENTQEANKTTQDYGGYTFTIPEGYQSRLSPKYGLVIFNEKEAYSIVVDYTNPYETQKTTYLNKFPEQAGSLVITVSNREYLALLVAAPTGGYAIQYATPKTAQATFVGLVVKADYAAPTTVEFSNLNQIIDSATLKEEVIKGSSADAGAGGINVYTIDFSEFPFQSQ